MNMPINKDILQGKWKQVRGQVKQQWGMLTDDQLDRISGRYEELAGLIQERYGYTKEQARQEVESFINRLNEKSPTR